MPDELVETSVIPQNEAKPPREDILNLVGLSQETARQIAEKEAKNTLRLETSRKNGEKIYDDLKKGVEVEVVSLGSGQFPISAVDSPIAFIKESAKRLKEITPPPPQDEVNEMLEGVADKALHDSEKNDFEVAVACFNYITNEKLATSDEYIRKLKTAAVNDQQKYELAKALEQVIAPQPNTTPQETMPTQPQETPIPTNTVDTITQTEPKLVDDAPVVNINPQLQSEIEQIAANVAAPESAAQPQIVETPVIAKDPNLTMPQPPQPTPIGTQTNQPDQNGGLFGRILRPVPQPEANQDADKLAA